MPPSDAVKPFSDDPGPHHCAHRRALVTAGPTEEPIDAVRFLGNRSSGRMGLAIAEALLARGWRVTLAVGPIRTDVPSHFREPIPGRGTDADGPRSDDPQARLLRFRTSRDLEDLLRRELPQSDLVVMAAAVADYRPRSVDAGKMRRSAEGMTLELEGVPDLLASTAPSRKAGAQVFGFALEPAERLESSARDKLVRKDLAGIVANPLETMDAPDVDGTVFLRDGRVLSPGSRLPKDAFARWLAGVIA
jgi:phosphopantothenoylcysteine decarboxylase/phosphopantothenate--cysteine ligase